MISLVKDIFNYISQIQTLSIFMVIAVFAFGVGCALFVLYKLIKPDLLKSRTLHDSIIKIEAQSNGRMSFADTITKHDKEITLNNFAISNIKEDIVEIKTDLKEMKKTVDLTLKICDSRKQDIPVSIDRRRK